MFEFYNYSIEAIFGGSLVLFASAIELGRYLGCRARESGSEQAFTLEGAALGLLALMIGFTFAMSLSRHETRRQAVLVEANAIGSTAMLAQLLPKPQDASALTLLSAYVNIRLDLKAQSMTEDSLRTAVDQSNIIQEKLWHLTMALAETDKSMVPTGLFIQSLGQVFDDQAKRVAAVRSHVPGVVLFGLYGIALVAAGFLGYGSGVKRGQPRLPPYLMGTLIALVMLLIHDLDRPGSGFIHISQSPMEEAAKSIEGYLNDLK